MTFALKRLSSQPAWLAAAILLLGQPITHYADALVRFGSGATAADIEVKVDNFLTDLAGVNGSPAGALPGNAIRSLNLDAVARPSSAVVVPSDEPSSTTRISHSSEGKSWASRAGKVMPRSTSFLLCVGMMTEIFIAHPTRIFLRSPFSFCGHGGL